MEPKSTQELIEHITQENYTDLIFDFDETICHLKIDWTSWFDEMNNIAQDLGENRIEDKSTLHADIERFIENYGETARAKINTAFLDCETNHLNEVNDNQLLVDFIKKDTSHNIHILSNNMTETITQQLERLGMLEKFSEIIGRDKTNISKPNPEPINRIVELSSNSKNDFLMIGDTLHSDIAAAERAGINGFLINMYK